MSKRLCNLIEESNRSIARLIEQREVLLTRLMRLQVKLTAARSLGLRYRKMATKRELLLCVDMPDWNGERDREPPADRSHARLDDPIPDYLS